ERYTGIARHTKDFDIFVRERDCARALKTLELIGCTSDVTFTHWLGKAYNSRTGDFIDVIFSSGSGIAVVDDAWFRHSIQSRVLGIPARLCPAEEIIWSKAFIMERERYDGNDVAHLLRSCASGLDWPRLLRRFDGHWRVLLAHLVLFGFIYPAERTLVPAWVIDELQRALHAEISVPAPDLRVCNGTLLSRAQYLVDIQQWGYADARLHPEVQMTPHDIAHWTEAISERNRRKEDHVDGDTVGDPADGEKAGAA
ncbi:MAG TPA: hypothetical protein VFM29_00420, partial [Vicinamibacteria bacterium]|nr:hypothetical protein [Vicinamibacteria bacterium]